MNYSIKTELMQHQKDAVNKLKGIKVGALFMDMGTGKTLTCFEWLRLKARKISKIMYFCPVSVKKTISDQIKEHTTASCYMFNKKTKQGIGINTDFIIIGIESMSSSNRMIFTALDIVDNKTAVIVDESTYIKNFKSNRCNWITKIGLKAKYRMILTGTPTSNGIQDLFSQMKFLSPLILGYNSFYSFAANHLEYSEKYKGMIVETHNTEQLAAKMKPYVYQVTKKECLDLPNKLYRKVYCDLSVDQRTAYNQAKQDFFDDIIGKEIADGYDVFCLFTRLQQICSGYEPIKKYDEITEKNINTGEIKEYKQNKLDTLMIVIDELPKDAKLIIWCKYIYDIDVVKDRLNKEFNCDCCAEYSGRLNEKNRNKSIDDFVNKKQFLIATQATGGHGLNNLTISSYAVYYNNNFKYGERLQSEDRQHRIGQLNNVTYIDIVTNDTIEERILTSLSKKEGILKTFRKEIDKIKSQKGKSDKKLKEVLRKL